MFVLNIPWVSEMGVKVPIAFGSTLFKGFRFNDYIEKRGMKKLLVVSRNYDSLM